MSGRFAAVRIGENAKRITDYQVASVEVTMPKIWERQNNQQNISNSSLAATADVRH